MSAPKTPLNTPAEAHNTLMLPLHAEDYEVLKRKLVRTIQVQRKTLTRDVVVEEQLATDGVVIERVPVGRYVDAFPPVREEGDLTVLPVVEEVLVVECRLLLKEEVHVRRVRSSSPHVETVTLREQHAVVTRSEARSPGDGSPVPVSPQASANIPPSRNLSMSNETIVAVYDTAAHAEAAMSDLLAAKVPQSAIHRHTSEGSYAAGSTTATTRAPEEKGFWSSLFGGDAGDDHAVYDRSLESGGNVVTVSGIPDRDYEAVMGILERHNPVDLDDRASSYGTSTTTTSAVGGAAAGMASTAASMATGATTGAMSTGTTAANQRTATDGGTIQLAEEQLSVGKRVINRGGTRIRRYVVETPVEQNVTLHDEKVTLERRPVTDGRPVTGADFSEKTIEMTETAEEAVVAKTARVKEEIALRKEATERVETVRDTVRREDVEIEQIPGERVSAGTTTTPVTPRTPKV